MALRTVIATLVLGWSAVVPPGQRAWGQDVGDAIAGQELAARECSSCHIIGPDALGGNLLIGAPTCMEVADDPAVTELALRVFLQSPHDVMPALMLSEAEVDDLARYILNLRRR